jgi:hypothetical protein
MSTISPQPSNTANPIAEANDTLSYTDSEAGESVFTKFGPVSSPGTDFESKNKNLAKYGTGDPVRTYPLYALWFMLTTEDWSQCFAVDGFRDQLFKELIDEHIKANPVPNTDPTTQAADEANTRAALLQKLNTLHMLAENNPGSIAAARGFWNNFLNGINDGFYGGRPCPGGGSILDFASLKNLDRT